MDLDGWRDARKILLYSHSIHPVPDYANLDGQAFEPRLYPANFPLATIVLALLTPVLMNSWVGVIP